MRMSRLALRVAGGAACLMLLGWTAVAAQRPPADGPPELGALQGPPQGPQGPPQGPPPEGQPPGRGPAGRPPEAPREGPPPREPGQPVNVRVDLTITDQQGAGTPVKKTVTLTLADREGGSIRSEADRPISKLKEDSLQVRQIPLFVDASPTIIDGSRIRLRMSLSYDLLDEGVSDRRFPRTTIRESLGLVLDNGKPLVVAQSADPIGDRKVTLEVKATILK